MSKRKYNHIIPAFILRNFKNPKTKEQVILLVKEGNIIDKRRISKQNQLFNIKNFYTKKSLKDLLKEIPGVTLNPIFEKPDENLEDNLGYLEDKFSKICGKIIKSKDNKPTLSEDEINFIKEYTAIQHIRNTKFRDMFEAFKTLEFGDYDMVKEFFKDELKKICNDDRIIEAELKKEECQIQKVQQEIRNKFKTLLDEKIDIHSLFIIAKKSRDDFRELVQLDEKNITLLKNNTSIPFIVPDTGIIEIEIKSKIEEIILPISSELCIKLSSDKSELKEIQDKGTIEEYNKLAYDESFKVVFSNDEFYLKSLKI